jgi:anti-sigma B factor antagonist
MHERATVSGVRDIAPGVCVIDIAGDVTPASETVLVAAYTQATDGGAEAIVLGFTGLEYMNSGGIGLLVMLLVRAQRRQQRVFAYGLSDHYREIFELTRLDEAVGIHESEGAALAAAAAPPA